MLAHLLARRGIDSVVVDNRTRREIEQTHRAGILEQDSVRLLVETRGLRPGAARRLPARGHRAGLRRRAATGSTSRTWSGASVWLYPQTDVFIDLADARGARRR